MSVGSDSHMISSTKKSVLCSLIQAEFDGRTEEEAGSGTALMVVITTIHGIYYHELCEGLRHITSTTDE
jgi:hypothetical protein